jgi:hypothetical protein
MTAAEVTRALTGFEERLRGLGVPAVDRLRPGLSPEDIDRISTEHGVRLSEDAAAWWGWHDGDRLNYEDGVVRRGQPHEGPHAAATARDVAGYSAQREPRGRGVDSRRPGSAPRGARRRA